jgi:hypothetical protein
MDPLTLAGMAVAALVQYVAAKGAHLVKHAANDVDQRVDHALDSMYDTIKARVSGEPRAERAFRELEADPSDERRQGRLEGVLEALVEDDPSFAERLQSLLDAAGAQPTRRVDISDAGAIAIEGDIQIRGTNVAGRDLTIGEDKE